MKSTDINYILLSDNTVEKIITMDSHGNLIEDAVVLWSEFFANIERRRVGRDEIDNIVISTVFLGIDHGFGISERPILFETMIFDESGNEVYCRRYYTWDEAEAGHHEAVEFVKTEKPQ